ncbi:uncharacterized protein ACIB01_011699 [Guaruba guarouba]
MVARSHGVSPLLGTLRAVAAAGADPDPRGARRGAGGLRATRRSLGLSQHHKPRRPRRRWDSVPEQRGRMTELQSALLLRRQLAGTKKRRRTERGSPSGNDTSGPG